jgi:glucokinase
MRVVGVDLGGTKLAAAVVDGDGRILHKRKLAIDRHDAARQAGAVAREVVEAAGLGWDRIAGVGAIVPGIYFAETGNVWTPNLFGPEQVPLRGDLEAELPVPVVLDSDRAGYVLGEQWLGAARGLTDVVFLAVGTGIGAGILVNGQICRGAGDIAGSVGWFALNPCRRPEYAQVGCWEAEAAGPAVARRAGAPDAEAVVRAARQGDAASRQVLEETARWLGMGIANLVSLLNPQMIVLGGGLMQAGDLLLEPLRREVLEWAQPLAARQVRIELTQLGEDAGVLGAARLALTRHVG